MPVHNPSSCAQVDRQAVHHPRRLSHQQSIPLHTVASTRLVEQQAAAGLAPHTLMQRAGASVAHLTLALAPHARCIWVACGPGNNGGDGFEAARLLHEWGKNVVLTWCPPPAGHAPPADASAAQIRALAAGVTISDEPPAEFDFCIDALLGLGGQIRSTANSRLAGHLRRLQACAAPCLAIDVPSGLNADTGADYFAQEKRDKGAQSEHHGAMYSIAAGAAPMRLKPTYCLSLLTLKPGIFTAAGRDRAGEIWWDDLGVNGMHINQPPDAWLLGTDRVSALPRQHALHASHKGSFGDVAVVGGASSGNSHMIGAALLAARAALLAGAGRVMVSLLGDSPNASDASRMHVDPLQPELMFRELAALDLVRQTIVCGCGGGQAVQAVLPGLLQHAVRLVLDADALNAISQSPELQTLLKERLRHGLRTVLTPHPLEAARLLGVEVAEVQADRCSSAQALAKRLQCVVVLKGSGTLVAAPGALNTINPTGNALLATAGTGDVLAGMLGAAWAGQADTALSTDLGMAYQAACSAVFEHGLRADRWAQEKPGQPLTASALARFSSGQENAR